MIRIELDEASLGATRIAISPLWDAFCSLHLAMPHRIPSRPYEEWVARAREVLREDERTDALRLLIDGPNGFPDFLLPRPVGATSVEAELETVRATPADVVRAGIAEHYPALEDHPRIRPYLVDPEAACSALADAYAAYWEGAMAAHWPTMQPSSSRTRSSSGPGPSPPKVSTRCSPVWRAASSGRRRSLS